MIIRTQNKDALVNFDNIDSIVIEGYHSKGYMLIAYAGQIESGTNLGEYNTKEEAEKVLNRIMDSYLQNEKICFIPEEEEEC